MQNLGNLGHSAQISYVTANNKLSENFGIEFIIFFSCEAQTFEFTMSTSMDDSDILSEITVAMYEV